MNCLCSTCRLTLISGGLSATRKLWQKSQWVLVNAVTGQVDSTSPAIQRNIQERLLGVESPWPWNQKNNPGDNVENRGGSAGIGFWGFGSMLAITISWSVNHSILWMILHGILSWLYVIYYAVKR
jgi:hypothetical protein